MGLFEYFRTFAQQVNLMNLQAEMGCPACRYWASTQDGRKECNHPDEWQPSFGGVHCSNCRVSTTAETL